MKQNENLMKHKERVHLGEGRMFRDVTFSYTLGKGDISLLAACKDAAVIQVVNYESLVKSPSDKEWERVNKLILPNFECDTFLVLFKCC